MRGGDNEGALRGALENVPYGADEQGKVGIPEHPDTLIHCSHTVIEAMEAETINYRQYTSPP